MTARALTSHSLREAMNKFVNFEVSVCNRMAVEVGNSQLSRFAKSTSCTISLGNTPCCKSVRVAQTD